MVPRLGLFLRALAPHAFAEPLGGFARGAGPGVRTPFSSLQSAYHFPYLRFIGDLVATALPEAASVAGVRFGTVVPISYTD